MRLLLPAIAAMTLLTACNSQADAPVPQETRETVQDKPATQAHEQIGAKLSMALLSDGISYRVAGGTETVQVGFGASQESIERIAREALGDETERGSNAECGAGPMDFVEYGPLQFNFQNGALVGWFAQSGSDVATVDGVKPGVTSYAVLERELGAKMAEGSTLEGEFSYEPHDGGERIGGFVDRDGTILSLNAGVNCFFR